MSLNRLPGQVAQGGELCDSGNVVVGTVIGDRLNPAKQSQDPISLEQGSLGSMPRKGYGATSDRVAVSLQIAHEIKEWLMRRSHCAHHWRTVRRRFGSKPWSVSSKDLGNFGGSVGGKLAGHRALVVLQHERKCTGQG